MSDSRDPTDPDAKSEDSSDGDAEGSSDGESVGHPSGTELRLAGPGVSCPSCVGKTERPLNRDSVRSVTPVQRPKTSFSRTTPTG